MSTAVSLSSSAALGALLETRFAEIQERAPATAALLAADAGLKAQAERVFTGSDFAHAMLLRDDSVLPMLKESGALETPRSLEDFHALLRDIDKLLMEETGLPVVIAEDPLTCVARGGGRILELQDEVGPGSFGLE